MTSTARVIQAVPDAPTLTRLRLAEERGHMSGRLFALYGLVGDALSACESAFPALLEGGPADVRAAATHLLSAGGKRVRPLLLALSARASQPVNHKALDQEQLVSLMAAAELTHAATLLHDDVLDNAEMRRGQEAARVRWGNSVSVLAGDFLLTRALEEIERTAVPGAMPALLSTIRKMIEGEALQLSLRGRSDAGLDTYYEVIEGKTASLFAFCGQAGALCAGKRELCGALAGYARHLGYTFQIIDDVLDIDGEERALGKSVMTDLREGKLTLPVLLALEARPELRPLLDRDPDDEALPDHTVLLLRRALVESEATRRAREVAAAEAEKGCASLRGVPEGPCRDALWQVAREMVQRHK